MDFSRKTKKFFCLFLLFPLFFTVSGFCFYVIFESANTAMADSGMAGGSNCFESKKETKGKSKNSLKACCFAQGHDAEETSLFVYAPVLAAFKNINFQIDSSLKKSISFSSAILSPPQKEKLASVIKRE